MWLHGEPSHADLDARPGAVDEAANRKLVDLAVVVPNDLVGTVQNRLCSIKTAVCHVPTGPTGS